MAIFNARPWAAALAIVIAATPIAPHTMAAEPNKEVTFSSDPAISAQQHAVYDVVHRYEQLLNVGNATEIVNLFAPDSVAEWNDKPTFVTRQAKLDAYNALFKNAKFTTVFGYAGIDVNGDTAFVRTHHHKGATVLEGGKEFVDLNREVFILRKINGEWKILLYIFNTDPVQGEG